MSEVKTWTFVDKSTWGDGPWQTEPDKVQWTDEETGLVCLVRRNPLGALCGYVGINPEHPWYGKGYSQCLEGCVDYCDWNRNHSPQERVYVHGGMTFSDVCDGDEEEGICHVPEPGKEDDLWWFGFDCAHAGDVVPGLRYQPFYGDESYKNVAYVQDQCSKLAKQLVEEGINAPD